jgi:hypothetical protein
MPRELRDSRYNLITGVFGDLRVSDRSDRILEQFQYNINTLTLTKTESNGGTVTQANNMCVLTSSTATNGGARLESKHTIRYRPGHSAGAYFTCLWTQPNATDTATQYIGILSSTDGFFMGFKNGVFVVGLRNASTDRTISISEFNIDHLSFIDFTKLNIFYIFFGWLGTSDVEFGVLWEGHHFPFHRMHLQNALTAPSIGNPVLPISMDITKTAGSTSLIMKSGSWNGWVLESSDYNPADRHFTGTATKNTVSAEAVIINFQNQSTFQSKTNKVVVRANLLGGSTEGTKPGLLKIYKNLTISSPSWSDVDATNSVMQTDTAGTVTPSDTKLLFAFPLAKSDSFEIDVEQGKEFVLLPGETATITGQSTANCDFTFTARWHEEF